MALGKNVKRLREALGLTQEALSERTKGIVSQGAITSLETRDSSRSKFAPILAAALGVSLDALVDDEPPPIPSSSTVLAKNGDHTIAQYDAGGSMGTGRLILDGGQPGIIKSWRVDHEWLRLNVKHYTSIANLCIVTGFGSSMMPKYNPGDPLLMDGGIKSLADDADGIYFFRANEYGYIKQLQRIPIGKSTVIRAKSYNPNYDTFDITKDMDFEIFGKILTIWKSEQV